MFLTKYIRGQEGWSNSSEKQNSEYKKRMVGWKSKILRPVRTCPPLNTNTWHGWKIHGKSTFQRMVLVTSRLPGMKFFVARKYTWKSETATSPEWGWQSVQLIELDFKAIKVELWNQQRSPSQARQHIATSRLDVDRWKTCFESFSLRLLASSNWPKCPGFYGDKFLVIGGFHDIVTFIRCHVMYVHMNANVI